MVLAKLGVDSFFIPCVCIDLKKSFIITYVDHLFLFCFIAVQSR